MVHIYYLLEGYYVKGLRVPSVEHYSQDRGLSRLREKKPLLQFIILQIPGLPLFVLTN